jgi:hypothetical protein
MKCVTSSLLLPWAARAESMRHGVEHTAQWCLCGVRRLGLCTSISTGYWLKITTEGSDSLALQTWLGVDRVDWRSERAQCQKDHQATVPHRYGCAPMVIGTGALDESYLWLLFFMSLFSLCAWCWGGTYDWVQLFLETDCNLVMNLKKNLR